MRSLHLLVVAALVVVAAGFSARETTLSNSHMKFSKRYLQGQPDQGGEGGHEDGGHEDGGHEDGNHDNEGGDNHEEPDDGHDEDHHDCPPDRPCNPTLAPTRMPTPPPSPLEANPAWKPPTTAPTPAAPTSSLFSNANYQQDAEIGLALGVALVVAGGVFGLFYVVVRAFRGNKDDGGVAMTHFGRRSMFDTSAHSNDAVDSYNNRVPFGTAIDVSMRDSQRGYGSEFGGSQHGYQGRRGRDEDSYYEEDAAPATDYGRGQGPRNKTKKRVERSTLDF